MKPDIDAIRERIEDRLTQKWSDGDHVYKDTEVWPCCDCYGKTDVECDNCMVARLIERLYQFEETDIPALLSYIEEQDKRIAELEQERDAAVMDMSVACIMGESCAICANCRDMGDQFPCAISDKWCCGQGWEWRGVKK